MAALYTYAQAAASGGKNLNPLSRKVIKQFLEHDQFTQIVPTTAVPGTENKYVRETQRPLVKVHNIDGTICAGVAKQEIITDEVGRLIAQPEIDRKVELSQDIRKVWTDQIEATGWEIADKWANQLINGTGATDGDITGLKALIDAIGSDAKYVCASTCDSGAEISFAYLDELLRIPKYGVDFIMMHSKIKNNLLVDFRSLGGNSMDHVKVPQATFGPGGMQIKERDVLAYNGIPIFENDYLGTETTEGGSGKYRVIAGSLSPMFGLHTFYPAATDMGFQFEPIMTKQSKHERYLTTAHYMGLSLKSEKAIAQLINIRYVEPS